MTTDILADSLLKYLLAGCRIGRLSVRNVTGHPSMIITDAYRLADPHSYPAFLRK